MAWQDWHVFGVMNYDYGLQFVRRGYVVAAPCRIPLGRRVDRDSYNSNDMCRDFCPHGSTGETVNDRELA